MRTIDEWLSFMQSARPITPSEMLNVNRPCPEQYLYGNGTTDYNLQLFNEKLKYFWDMEYDEDEIYDQASYYFLYKAKPMEYIGYKLFLEKSVKLGLRLKTRIPESQNPRFSNIKLSNSYGMLTFTTKADEITTDEQAIEYFDKIVERYLIPESKFRMDTPCKMNVWIEYSTYYHMHVFYKRDFGLWLKTNKGTLKINKTIKWFINNQCYRPENSQYKGDYNNYITHCNKALLYDYDDKGSRVVKPYFREIDKID